MLMNAPVLLPVWSILMSKVYSNLYREETVATETQVSFRVAQVGNLETNTWRREMRVMKVQINNW